MPLYDPGLFNYMDGCPLKRTNGKCIKFIEYEILCTSFGIGKGKTAFQVEHLMTIMQAQLADKNITEKLKIMTKMGYNYIKELKPKDQTRKEKIMANQKHFLISNFPECEKDKDLSEITTDEKLKNHKENTKIRSSLKENNQRKNTEPDDTITVIVETGICKQIIQVFIDLNHRYVQQ